MTLMSPVKQVLEMRRVTNLSIGIQMDVDNKNKRHCNDCKRAFSKKYYYRHKCVSKIKPKGLKKILMTSVKSNDSFNETVFSQFKETGPSEVCMHDPTWQILGLEEFKKFAVVENKERRAKVRTMTYMNNLAVLFKLFSTVASKEGVKVEVADMFKVKYCAYLKEALEVETIGKSLKHMIIYALRTAADKLRGLYYVSDDEVSARDVEKVQAAKTTFVPGISKPLVEYFKKRREDNLRLPKNVPSQESMQTIKEYINKKTEEAISNGINESQDFVNLRRLTLARLVSYNGRRVSEPSYLTISAFEGSLAKKWIDERAVERTCSAEEKILFDKYFVAFVEAKNSSSKVDLIIPVSTVPAIKILCDEGIRKCSGVRSDYTYVFANVKHTKGAASGYHDVSNIVNRALSRMEIKERVTSTSIRHFLSVLFDECEEADSMKKIFYKHLWHSERINKEVSRIYFLLYQQMVENIDQIFFNYKRHPANVIDYRTYFFQVYQVHPAVKLIKSIGPFLNDVDNGLKLNEREVHECKFFLF